MTNATESQWIDNADRSYSLMSWVTGLTETVVVEIVILHFFYTVSQFIVHLFFFPLVSLIFICTMKMTVLIKCTVEGGKKSPFLFFDLTLCLIYHGRKTHLVTAN